MTFKEKKLGAFSLAMIAIGSIVTVRTLPELAVFGASITVTILIAACLFLMPCVLASIDLSTKYPDGMGAVTWARYIFGDKTALFTAYVELATNVALLPLIVFFIVGNFLQLMSPFLQHSKMLFSFFSIILIFLAVWINLRGLKASTIVASLCSILGVGVPIFIILLFSLIWMFYSGDVLHVDLSPAAFIPDFRGSAYLSSFIAAVLSFAGVEVITVHAQNINSRVIKRQYTIAFVALVVFAVFAYTIGPLGIASVVPRDKISFASGITQVLAVFFAAVDAKYLLYPVVILMCFGAFGALSNWTIATIKPLFYASKEGLCTNRLAQTNSYGAPKFLLIIEGVIVALIALSAAIFPTINDCFWFVTTICTQNAVLLALVFFVCHIKHLLVMKKYVLDILKIILAGAGILVGFLTIYTGFIPNPQSSFASNKTAYAMLVIGALIVSWVPVVFLYLSKSKTCLKNV